MIYYDDGSRDEKPSGIVLLYFLVAVGIGLFLGLVNWGLWTWNKRRKERKIMMATEGIEQSRRGTGGEEVGVDNLEMIGMALPKYKVRDPPPVYKLLGLEGMVFKYGVRLLVVY